MNTDSYYEIGHSHIACEDYALSGQVNPNLAYAIVSDGCSASAHVDVGARVLAHAAKNFLHNEYVNNIEIFKASKVDDFCVPIIASAHGTMKSLGLNNMCLDATLLLAISNGAHTRVYAYGDGVVLVKYRNGNVQTFRIEFTEGAPYYLSYSLDSVRREAFFQEFKQRCNCHEGKIIEGVFTEQPSPSYHDPQNLKGLIFDFIDIEFVTLMSDGAMSYEKLEGGKVIDKVPMAKVLDGIARYKNFNGQFVERRMLNFRKECQKEGIGHYDDMGVASINLGR